MVQGDENRYIVNSKIYSNSDTFLTCVFTTFFLIAISDKWKIKNWYYLFTNKWSFVGLIKALPAVSEA